MNFSIFKRLVKREILKRALSLFSLSTVAFAFQACYGTLNDFEYDVEITGRITSDESGDPIPNIQVEAKEINNMTWTDANGEFYLYAPMDTIYTLLVSDIDSTANGEFYSGKKVIDNSKKLMQLETRITMQSIKN
ncbi:MAG: carboxypeptidase-like regulatory domain-containing protein [Bacteroidales bacterium]|nr:carboxypeptidase-like regulatory domain-containing protein [Bacteroidales bacterium]MBN2820597.1 carboxypeptidase-like regulatory domain-containing protein [Bacteroidales bacterium]